MAYNTSFRDAIDWRYSRVFRSTRAPAIAPDVSKKGHQWTSFQRQALFGLMAAQYHTGDPMALATMLNQGLHDTDFRQDIKARHIEKEVNRILEASPAFAGLLMRHKCKRITRKLKMAFDRAMLPKGRKPQIDEGRQTGGGSVWGDDAGQANHDISGVLAVGAGNGGWGDDAGQVNDSNEDAPAADTHHGGWGSNLAFPSIETTDNVWGTSDLAPVVQSTNAHSPQFDDWGSADAAPVVQVTKERSPDFGGWGIEDAAPAIQSSAENATFADDWGTGTAASPVRAPAGSPAASYGWCTSYGATATQAPEQAPSPIGCGWGTVDAVASSEPSNKNPAPVEDDWSWGSTVAPLITESAKEDPKPFEDDLGWGTSDAAPLVESPKGRASSHDGGWGIAQAPVSQDNPSESDSWGPVDQLISECRPKSTEEGANSDSSNKTGGIANVDVTSSTEMVLSIGIHPDRLRLLETTEPEEDGNSASLNNGTVGFASYNPNTKKPATSNEVDTPANRLAMLEKMNPSGKPQFQIAPNRNTEEFATFESHMAELQVPVRMPQVDKEIVGDPLVDNGEYKTFSRPKAAALRVLDDEDDLTLNYDYEECPKGDDTNTHGNGKATPGWVGDYARTPGWDTSYRTPAWVGRSKSASGWGGRTSGFEDIGGWATPAGVMSGAATPGTNWGGGSWVNSPSSPPAVQSPVNKDTGKSPRTSWDDPAWASFSATTSCKQLDVLASSADEVASVCETGWGGDELINSSSPSHAGQSANPNPSAQQNSVNEMASTRLTGNLETSDAPASACSV